MIYYTLTLTLFLTVLPNLTPISDLLLLISDLHIDINTIVDGKIIPGHCRLHSNIRHN